MGVQVLVATMNQNDHSLIKKMNIKSDAIVGNQADFNLVERFKYKDNDITYLNFDEKGWGSPFIYNRNSHRRPADCSTAWFRTGGCRDRRSHRW